MKEEDIKVFETVNSEQALAIMNLLVWITNGCISKDSAHVRCDMERIIEIFSKKVKLLKSENNG